MKIKLDESMPSALAELLRFRGHDVSTVPEEQLSGTEDSVVFARATKEDRLLMNFDHDFGDIRSDPIPIPIRKIMKAEEGTVKWTQWRSSESILPRLGSDLG